MKKIVRKLQKVKLPASNIKEMDLSNWEADRTAREQPTQSANIDDRRKENDGPRRKQEPVLDKDNESEPKSDSSNITSKNITSRENPNPEPLKLMSDFVSRTINSPIRSERSMPGPQQKTADRIIAFRRARGLDEEAQKMGLVQGPNNPKKVDEEIANAVGTGNIAGMGVPLEGKPENWAEPPVRPRKRKKYKDRTKDEQNDTTADIAMIRRADPLGEELETGSFAGNKTFVVNDDMFIKARMEKKRGQHWKTYLGGDKYEMIRQHANKNKKAPIILQNEKTGAMMYARYGGKHDNKRDS